jgi:hypothetical protein
MQIYIAIYLTPNNRVVPTISKEGKRGTQIWLVSNYACHILCVCVCVGIKRETERREGAMVEVEEKEVYCILKIFIISARIFLV